MLDPISTDFLQMRRQTTMRDLLDNRRRMSVWSRGDSVSPATPENVPDTPTLLFSRNLQEKQIRLDP
jgi:SRSO17 transposase